MTTPLFPSVIGHNVLDGGTDAQDGNNYPGPLLQEYAAAVVGAAGVLYSNPAPSGVELFGPGASASVAPSISNGADCTINSSGVSTINGEPCFTVSATATGASTNWFEIQLNNLLPFSSDTLALEFSTNNPASVNSIGAYMGTSGYSLFAVSTKNMGADGNGTSPFFNLGRLALTFVSADWIKNGYANATNVQQWINSKIRVFVASGNTVVFSLRSITASIQKKGRIAVCADDGYLSFVRAGYPILESYGVRSTMAIIPNQVGNSGGGFCSLSDLRRFVAQGGQCVAHGPLQNATNLFTAPYTTTGARVADMVTSRDYLLQNGLTDSRGARCYVWPQGVYASVAGEADLLDAAQAAGFSFARAADPGTATPSTRSQHLRGLSARCHQRMTFPILGHTYQGASATADDATETTNVNGIITSIQALATNGSDGAVMLHKVVARGGATGGSGTIEIEQDRLAAIAEAIQAEVRAGKLDSVLLGDFS